jgi:hypothetical protein
MAAVNPVASQSAMPPETVGVAQKEAPTLEHKLLDYIARHQAEGLARGQHLGNPAALSGEALKSLKGYFERATALQDSAVRKANKMKDGSEGVQTATGGLQLTSLPSGPAGQSMDPVTAKRGAGEKIAAVSDTDLERTVEALVQAMQYNVETTLISTATNNVTKSAMTLLHGQ